MNPYQSPREFDIPRSKDKPAAWHPFTWAVVGFAAGTLLAAPFILCPDLRGQLQGGAVFGGPIGALFGWAHGRERQRKNEQNS
jgi:hypothetical protein